MSKNDLEIFKNMVTVIEFAYDYGNGAALKKNACLSAKGYLEGNGVVSFPEDFSEADFDHWYEICRLVSALGNVTFLVEN